MRKSTSYPARLDIRPQGLRMESKAKEEPFESSYTNSSFPIQQSKPGLASSFSVALKWTKAELRNRFYQGLNPKAWARPPGSHLSSPKKKSQPLEQDARYLIDTEKIYTPTLETIRRATPGFIDQNQCQTLSQEETLTLPSIVKPLESISIQTVVCKTVKEASIPAEARQAYAQSVEFTICGDSGDASSEGSSPEEVISDDKERFPDTAEHISSSATAKETIFDVHANPKPSNSPARASSATQNSPKETRFRECYVPYTRKLREGLFSNYSAPPGSLVDNAIRNRGWGLNRSELILRDHEMVPTELPNCTASHSQKNNWNITNSMLSAYTAMRGPYRLAGRDIFVWMDRCAKTFDPPEEFDNHIGSCKTVIRNLEPLSFDPPPLEDEPSQKCIFSVPRPPYEHIKPPSEFSREEHPESTIKFTRDMRDTTSISIGNNDLSAGKEDVDEFFISDDEGGSLDGRISPYIFDWKLEEIKAAKYHSLAARGIDINDQDWFGAGSEDSSLEYIAVGYDENNVPNRLKEWTQGQQMDGVHAHTIEHAAEQLLETNHIMLEARPASSRDSKPYTDSEIIAALNAADARTLDGIPPHEAEAVLQDRYKSLQICLEAEKNAELGIAETQNRIRMREAQFERVSISVRALLEKKAHKIDRRREEIYRHVSQNLREIKKKTTSKQEQTWELAIQMANLMIKEKQLEMMMVEEAKRVGVEGLSDPDDIEQVVQQLVQAEEEYAEDDDESFF